MEDGGAPGPADDPSATFRHGSDPDGCSAEEPAGGSWDILGGPTAHPTVTAHPTLAGGLIGLHGDIIPMAGGKVDEL